MRGHLDKNRWVAAKENSNSASSVIPTLFIFLNMHENSYITQNQLDE